MGLIISRFKKKKTTLEILEKLEKDITGIEQYRTNTEQRRRRIVGQLIVYSVGAYVLAAAIFYFYWFPSTLKEQIISVTPLLLFPLVVILLKMIVTYYYSRKITHNEQKLSSLRNEKKKILENVMDKETYKVARTILEKFAPEQLQSKRMISPGNKIVPAGRPSTTQPPAATPLRSNLHTDMTAFELRRRTLPSAVNHPPGLDGKQSFSAESLTPFRGTHLSSVTPMPSPRPSINGQGFNSEYRPPGPPLPRPVLPRERSYIDRIVEYLVGDGPSNRFALICKACESHNGMALKEEFEYLPFRCCYCHFWNPARKQRPQAPRLTPTLGVKSQLLTTGKACSDDSTSDSEKNSGSDSSDEDSGSEHQILNTCKEEDIKDGNGDVTTSVNESEASPNEEVEQFLKSLDKDNLETSEDASTEKLGVVQEPPADQN